MAPSFLFVARHRYFVLAYFMREFLALQTFRGLGQGEGEGEGQDVEIEVEVEVKFMDSNHSMHIIPGIPFPKPTY
jgi:hypothetical protein